MAAAGAGVLLALAFPPADAGWVAFIALVPLLWAWRGASLRQGALFGFMFGVVFFGWVLEFIRYFGAVAIVPLVLANAAYTAGIGALVAAFDRRGWRSPVLVAAVWTLLDALRGRWPLGGLPFGQAGVAMHDIGPVRLLASWGGIALVTFFVVVVNGALLDLALAGLARATAGRRAVPAATRAWGQVWSGRAALAVLMGLAALVAVVDLTRPEPRVTGKVRFALLQGNDQNRDLTAAEVAGDYLMRRHLALAATLRAHYDLIVFPESALERDPRENADVRAALVDVAARHGAVVLANARTRAPDGGVYNANLVYDPNGHLQGIYAKQHLVPFGEYVPWREYLGFIDALKRVPYDYEAGTTRRLFRVAGHRFGTVICFESVFGPLVRDFVRDGAQLIVVTTNNRSYRRSGLSEQHVAFSQIRAAETGRVVLHASISGITAVVDAEGNVRDRSELFVNRIVTGEAATATGETPYVRLGDWVLLACGIGLIAAASVATRPARAARRGP